MGSQVEPVVTLYEIKGIVLLISRLLLTDELNHVVSEANQLLDCVGLEIGDGSISFFLFWKMSVLFKLYGIPCDHMVSVITNILAEYSFLDPLSNL